MSIQAVAWALEVPVSSTVERAVLIGVANHADDQGHDAFPSVATLARYACVSERTVQRTLRELERSGLISQGDPSLRDVVVERIDRRPNVYDLAMSRGDTVSSRSSNGVTEKGERGDTHVTRTVPKPFTSPKGDGLFESFYQFWTGHKYTSGVQIPKSMRGRLNTAVKEARLAGITPSEVQARGRRYVETWREMERTPQALLANWHRFEPTASVQQCDECENRGLVWVDKNGERTSYDDPGQTTAIRCPSCTEAVNA